MNETVKLTIVYEQGDDGYVLASVPEVPGTLSQGSTREEARENVLDALRLMLRTEPDGDGRDHRDRELLELTISA